MGRRRKVDYTHTREYKVFKVLTQEVLPKTPCILGGKFWPWLLSPKGEPLQLDIMFHTIPLAIEVQGEQHITRNKFFFKNEDDWRYYIECDKIKEEVCKKYNIPLLKVMPDDPIDAESLRQRVMELTRN